MNKNIVFKGLLLADNGIGVSSFDNTGPIKFEDTRVIGLTVKARELLADTNLVRRRFLQRHDVVSLYSHLLFGFTYVLQGSISCYQWWNG